MLDSTAGFRAETTACDDGVLLLELFGEIDCATATEFEAALEAAISSEPKQLVIDLSGTAFISAAGFGAIGRCGFGVDLMVTCKNDFQQKILQLLGYDEVVCDLAK